MSPLAVDRERLRQMLRRNSLLFGDFTLTSGKKSRYYFDSKLTTLTAEGSYLTACQVLCTIAERGLVAEAIGGMTLGADPIVCAVAALSHADGCPIRAFLVRKEGKQHGTGRRIEGGLEPGCRVIVVDDVVTTGGSTLQAIGAAEDAGCQVVAVLSLVDRGEGGAERLAAWPYYPLFERSEIFGDAEAPGA